jgi:hypothetical protein
MLFAPRARPSARNLSIRVPESPKNLQSRVHSGGPKGGLWNQAWEQFFRTAKQAGRNPTKEQVIQFGKELVEGFEITFSHL